MVVDMGYWSKVFKRLGVVILTVLGVYLTFKLAMFFLPFLIAFIISLLIEPIIRLITQKTKLSRKISAIIVLVIVFLLLIGLLILGITTLISETTKLLEGLNTYVDTIYQGAQNLIKSIDFSRFEVSEEVAHTIQNAIWEFLGTLSNMIKNLLTSLMGFLTSIPTIIIYVVITLLSIYFVCTDKLFILDQIEHHMPKEWVKKIGVHLKGITQTLGEYLKAQVTLILISFIISLTGLYLFKFIGLEIEYPLMMALFIGFVDALPILGSGTVMVPWAIFLAFNGNMKLAIAVFVLWLMMTIIRQLLEPRIVGKHIGIHPLFTLIAMYTGFKLMGVLRYVCRTDRTDHITKYFLSFN